MTMVSQVLNIPMAGNFTTSLCNVWALFLSSNTFTVKTYFPVIGYNFLCFHLWWLPLDTGHHWEESGSLIFLHRVFRHPLFPGLNSSSSLSVPLYERCLDPFIIFTGLYWSCSTSSVSLSRWKAQNCCSHLFLIFLMVGMGVLSRRKGNDL